MSDTPRTDAVSATFYSAAKDHVPTVDDIEAVLGHARMLEREVSAANQRGDRWSLLAQELDDARVVALPTTPIPALLEAGKVFAAIAELSAPCATSVQRAIHKAAIKGIEYLATAHSACASQVHDQRGSAGHAAAGAPGAESTATPTNPARYCPACNASGDKVGEVGSSCWTPGCDGQIASGGAPKMKMPQNGIALIAAEIDRLQRFAPDQESGVARPTVADTLKQAQENVRPTVEAERANTTHYPPTKG